MERRITSKPNRLGFRCICSVRKHIPSGILIVWLDRGSKIHTKSIRMNSAIDPDLRDKLIKLEARIQLLLAQLDTYELGYIRPAPMITVGLTRDEARKAYRQELIEGDRQCLE